MTFTSQLRKALDETLLHKAPGKAFDRLAAHYDYPRPHTIPRWAWRRACLAAVFGKTQRLPTLHAFLEGALAPLATPFVAFLDPAFPQRLHAPAAPFAPSHVTRLVRLEGLGLFRIATITHSTEAELLPVATAYWDRADWSALTHPHTRKAELLAFELHEPTPDPTAHPRHANGAACVRVLLWDEAIAATPPTYLQTANRQRPNGQPLGGAVQANVSEHGHPHQGPFPLYLVGYTTFPELAAIASRRLVPPGFRVEFLRRT